MKLQVLAVQFLLTLHLVLHGGVCAEKVSFHVGNKCPFPIWPGIAPNAGSPVVESGGFYLPRGKTKCVQLPWGWSGRLWARTGCNFLSDEAQTCETGDCGGRLKCNGLIGKPPVTLVQIAVRDDKSKADFYDVSIVDGYNIPVSVMSRPVSAKCTIGGCGRDVKSACPAELRVVNRAGQVVACRSACLAFNCDRFCCRNEFSTAERCGPSVYSMIFKSMCPNYYTYAFDTPPPLVNCMAEDYTITFCPAGWGATHHYSTE